MPRTAGLTPVHVLVGLVRDERNRLLISQRLAGTHLAGSWEFPGGKREPHESRFAALRRELAEELGIDLTVAEPFLELEHDYPDRSVRLDVWWVVDYVGVPRALEGQQMRWVEAVELAGADLLPADRPIVEAIEARLRAR